MWDLGQLPSALLYLSSTAAQVWAALLIFYVLLLRDLGKGDDEKRRDIWNFVNEHVANFRTALLSGLDNSPERYKPYEFNRHDILHSTTDWECFGRFLDNLAMSGLILKEGKNLGISDPKTFWEPLLSANFRVKALKIPRKKGFQNYGFQIGMGLIAFNVFVLGFHPAICAVVQVATAVLLLSLLANLFFGALMYLEIKKAVF